LINSDEQKRLFIVKTTSRS